MSGTSTIEVSSTTSRSQSSGASSLRRKLPVLGSVSSRRWIVFASSPVLSDRRFAGRPVGAQSAIAVVFARRILNELDGLGAAGLIDAHRARGADAVAVQEQHDLADHLLLGPTANDALRPFRANTGDFAPPPRLLLDDCRTRHRR